MNEYIYLGDRLTRPELRRMPCRAVRRSNLTVSAYGDVTAICWLSSTAWVNVLYWGDFCGKLKNKRKNFWRLKELPYICGMK